MSSERNTIETNEKERCKLLSRLDYCNAVLAHLPVFTIAPIQRVQSAVARLIKDLRPQDQVTPTLRDLHWLLIRHRITYKLCVLMHLVQTCSSPSYYCLVSWRPQWTCHSGSDSDLPTPITTNRSPPDSSLANDVFHTPDPKLGMNRPPSLRV